ncbi:MAG: hypothetical protein H6807_08750 [Planctomycetes bacterium]|nr:hypothetical protein [Planctomycetota bacterium]
MKKNFVVEDACALVCGDIVYEVCHFNRLREISVRSNGVVQILIDPSPEYRDRGRALLLHFEAVSFFEIRGLTKFEFFHNINEIGYMPSSQDHDDYLVAEEHASPDDHFAMRVSDGYLRIYAESATLCARSS